jgi:hypothetical protein
MFEIERQRAVGSAAAACDNREMSSNPLPRSASALFSHVMADHAPLHRAILDVFAASKRQFRLHLRPDDVLLEADQIQSGTPDCDTPRTSPAACRKRLSPIPSRKRVNTPTYPYYDSPNEEGIHQFDPKRADETTQSSPKRLIQP